MKIRRQFGRAVLIALACAVMVFTGCNHKLDHIPDALIGYWTTDAPGYRTRYLKLEKDFVLIGINQDDMPNIQSVRDVECEAGETSTVCTISSINFDGVQSLTLEYNPADGGTIRIRHEGGIWTRHEPPPDL